MPLKGKARERQSKENFNLPSISFIILVPMDASSNGASSPYDYRVESGIIGSRPPSACISYVIL